MLPVLFRNSDGGFVLVDEFGLPRFWAAVWQLFFCGRRTPSTVRSRLRDIEAFYVVFDQNYGSGSLDDALGSANLNRIEDGLDIFFIGLRNAAITPGVVEKRWRTAFQFVSGLQKRLSRSQIISSRFAAIRGRLEDLERQYGSLRPARKSTTRFVRALPPAVLQELYNLLQPESEQNPFKQRRTQWRIFVLFLLLLHQGLRRSEALVLRVDSVKRQRTLDRNRATYWLQVATGADVDPRASRPSLKNAQAPRPVPLSDSTALAIRGYSENWRGRPNHPFLLNSQRNMPLSSEGVNKAFQRISECLSKAARNELLEQTGSSSISPHDLRHTAAVIRLRQFWGRKMGEQEAMQNMRSYFGWSRESSMPQLYAKAAYDERLATVWNSALDDRAEMIRNLVHD